MPISTKILLALCGFAGLSLVMLNTIYQQGLINQSISFLLGIGTYLATVRVPFGFWKAVSKLMLVGLIALLLSTYILGKTTKGSTRWISIGSAQFQPSQFIKPVLALAFATYAFGASGKQKYAWRRVVKISAMAVVPLALVFFQPDLGTTILLAAMCLALFVYWGLPGRYFALFGVAFVIFAVVAWFFLLKPYQKERVFTLVNPTNNLSTSGYNALQSQIAVGSGKVLGRGLGHGVQSQLRFLPERQTDFFFASLAEELGFVGTGIVLFFYALFFSFLSRVIRFTRDNVGKMYSFGILSILFVQFTVNVGMNIGILPITGVTLPLLSYGGSSIIAICFSIGLMISAQREGNNSRQVEIRSFL